MDSGHFKIETVPRFAFSVFIRGRCLNFIIVNKSANLRLAKTTF